MEKYTCLTKEEYLNLYEKSLEELIDISHKITVDNFDNSVEACSIISAKTGMCSENCKYCAQSCHNHASIECHPLLDVETVKNAAISAKENGAKFFAIVTSGRVPTGKDFDKILEMVKAIRSIEGLSFFRDNAISILSSLDSPIPIITPQQASIPCFFIISTV